jgi:hypothetical protein
MDPFLFTKLTSSGQLDCDFVFAAGPDVDEIRPQFNGLGSCAWIKRATLLGSKGKEVRFEKPVVCGRCACFATSSNWELVDRPRVMHVPPFKLQ